MNLEGKICKMLKGVFFRSLKPLQELVSDNAMLKSTKFGTKCRVAVVFTTFPLEIISITKHEKMQFFNRFS
jgi:hypothetical protein